jgi:LuxR family glucitol operon transcriptional activator
MKNVYVRDKDDYIVAKILTRALECLFRKDCAEAEAQLDKAKDLSPNYFEVHRVKARLHTELEDYFSAETEYEAAISLAPTRAPLRLWFAGFLSWQLGDQERALTQLLEAEKLAPNSAYVKLECARVLHYQRKFSEAADRLRSVQDVEKLSSRMRRAHLDLWLQNDLRKAEQLTIQQEFVEALRCLEAAKKTFEGASPALIDQRTIRNIGHVRRHMPQLKRAFQGLPEEKRLGVIDKWLADPKPHFEQKQQLETNGLIVAAELSVAEKASSPPNRGRLVQLHSNYGFVDTGGSRFFFHRSGWTGQQDFLALGEGTIVDFEIGSNGKGPCAIDVRPLDEAVSNETEGSVLIGAVKSLATNYGFIKLDRGGDLFFHETHCTPTTKFKKLASGNRVRCTLEKGVDGRRRGINVELYSGV